ncbi:MAG TPA: nickel pincer cofactor biosynthesis protein LarC [Candidatus Binatia bacterium]|jgi:hypothetical protein
MRAYLDAFSGISGDMTVGALLDCGFPFSELQRHVAALPIRGCALVLERRAHGPIDAAKFDVRTTEPQPERTLATIRGILESATLPPRARALALAAFQALAEAEGRVHGVAPERVHFHEVGGVDAIVDILGAALGVDALGITEIFVSPLPLGSGVVDTQHGRIPVPAPATVELLRGYAVRPGDGEGEMVTPTGAAIVRGFGAVPAPAPSLVVVRAGYGSGTRTLADRPNVLRILLGEASASADEMLVVETNIDDMSPELYAHATARLFAAGAVDVVLVPVQMKKGRPGVLLQVLAPPARRDEIAAVLFAETTTIGLRFHGVQRLMLPRETREVVTPYGPITVKVATGPAGPIAAPEYESCRAAAERHGVPLRVVYEAARRAAG